MNAVRVARQLARHSIPDGDCWRWVGYTDRHGYGVIRVGGSQGRTMLAHRAAYECYVADIPEGLTIDHLCRVVACVNPWHMEPVPLSVNLDRAAPWRKPPPVTPLLSHCVNGHPYSGDNIYSGPKRRACRACNREHVRRYRARKAQEVARDV